MTGSLPDTALPDALDGLDIATGLQRMSGNEALYRQVAHTFLTDYASSADIARSHLAGGDDDRGDLVRLIHTTKGLLRSLGANEAGDAAQSLEAALRRNGAVEGDLVAYAREMTRVITSLQSIDSGPSKVLTAQDFASNDGGVARILMVDDEPDNIALLAGALGGDYQIGVAESGMQALSRVADAPPDLILLDVMMPGMDGYEVCERLQADPSTRDIPIIFVTARDDDADETHGLSLGAVDYIRKPVTPAIARARVRTHLALRHARQELEIRNNELESAIRAREDMERVMRHDLKSPLNAVIGMPDVLLNSGDIDERVERSLTIIRNAGERMLSMINLSLDLARIEQGTYDLKSAGVILKTTLEGCIADLRRILVGRDVVVDVQWDEGAPQLVEGEEILLQTMISNLLKNAVEASPEGGCVDVLVSGSDRAVITIRNKGSVPEDIRSRFFEKYITSGKRGGTGLGTYSAALMAQVQGGTIDLDTSKAGETSVIVSLPIARA